MKVILLLTFAVVIAQGALVSISKKSLEDADIECRREILIQINKKIEKIAKEHKKEVAECNKSLETAVKRCNRCRKNLCERKSPLSNQVLREVSSTASSAITYSTKSVKHIKSWFKKSIKFMGSRAKDLAKGLNIAIDKVGDVVEETGDKVKDFFTGIFGRKRRLTKTVCRKSCPMCKKLDRSKYSKQEIVENVCGKRFVDSQKKVTLNLKWLEDAFNKTADKQILKRIQYDSSTVNWFKQTADRSYYETKKVLRSSKDSVRRKIKGDFYLGNMEKNGRKIGREYISIAYYYRIVTNK